MFQEKPKKLQKKVKAKKEKNENNFGIPKQRLKMQREISNNVKIGNLVTPFQNVEKSPTFNNSSSDFDNANLKVKKKLEGL